jgi:hypothetical protein
MMKYKVVYNQKKKKGTSHQEAVFYKIEDASMWEQHVKTQGCTDIEIVPVF